MTCSSAVPLSENELWKERMSQPPVQARDTSGLTASATEDEIYQYFLDDPDLSWVPSGWRPIDKERHAMMTKNQAGQRRKRLDAVSRFADDDSEDEVSDDDRQRPPPRAERAVDDSSQPPFPPRRQPTRAPRRNSKKKSKLTPAPGDTDSDDNCTRPSTRGESPSSSATSGTWRPPKMKKRPAQAPPLPGPSSFTQAGPSGTSFAGRPLKPSQLFSSDYSTD